MRPLTIRDLEMFYSGRGGHPFLPIESVLELTKGSVTTGSGIAHYNTVYGVDVFTQLNTEANVFGILPKTTWSKSGWRIIKDWAYSGSLSGLDTYVISETGNLPDPYVPDVVAVKTKPKIVANTFEVSDVIQALAEHGDDDIWGTIEQLRTFGGVEHKKAVNKILIRKVVGRDDATSETNDATYQNKMLSLDAVIASYDEVTAFALTDPTIIDVYGLSRSDNTDSWANSVVDYSTTLRSLTDDMIRNMLANLRTKGANTTVMLTGYDTYADIQGLYIEFMRYLMGENYVQFGINGIQTANGVDAGVKVASLYGIPLITAVDTPVDGKSRIYFLDTSDSQGIGSPTLSISVARPTEYFETRDPFILDKFAIRGVYRTMGEVVCRGLAFQGKIRDLQ